MDEWYRLRAAGVRDSLVRRLMNALERYEDIFLLEDIQLVRYYKAEEDDMRRIRESRKMDISEDVEKLKAKGIEVISLKDERYPFFLKNISQPPTFLYIAGKIEFPRKSIAVVGTRRMTAYGRSACEKIAGELAGAGVTVVSGLASGVDGAAHEKSLAKMGRTIAVVGSGLDVIYPRENRDLWERIGREGTIISEYPLGTPPNQYNFPARNRIIAGLSMGVVVIESREKGGSLITASLALDEGRDVYAVPGDIFSPSSLGCNNLIKDSRAKLVTSGQEILDEYGWESQGNHTEETEVRLTGDEARVFEALKRECNLDELIVETKIGAGELLAYLMELELKGLICGAPGGKYRRKVLVNHP